MIRWRLGPYRGWRGDYQARRKWESRASLQALLWAVLLPITGILAALVWGLFAGAGS